MNLKKLILIIGLFLASVGILAGIIIYIRTSADTREQIAFESEIEAEMEAYTEEYPIIINLPVIKQNYRIDYGFCEQSDEEFCLMISSRPNYTEEAESFLRNLEGFDNKYKIEYYTCENYCDE